MQETPPALVEADGLSMNDTIGPRQVPVLRGLDLRISAGSSVAIAGPSGSGKTSLLLLLSGLERPAQGRIRFDGTDLATLDSNGWPICGAPASASFSRASTCCPA